MGGIVVHRVPLYPSHDANVVRRFANYASFAVSASLAGSVVATNADLTYIYHPPASAALPGIVRRLLLGIPYVLEIQDLWPDSLLASGVAGRGLVVKILGRYCDITYRTASRIIVSSPGMKAMLAARNVPSDKIETIYNWCHEEALSTLRQVPELGEASLQGRFNVLFAGNLGPAQDLLTLLEAARITRDECPEVQYLVAGAGLVEDELRRSIDSQSLGNVRMLGQLEPAQVAWLMTKADALLVLLRDEPLFAASIPSKTQAYLFAGRPILLGVRGDAADLVARASAGICFTPGDPRALVRAINELLAASSEKRAQMGSAGRSFYQAQLSREAGMGRVDRVLRDAVRRTKQ